MSLEVKIPAPHLTDGVALFSLAHPRPPWWKRPWSWLRCRYAEWVASRYTIGEDLECEDLTDYEALGGKMRDALSNSINQRAALSVGDIDQLLQEVHRTSTGFLTHRPQPWRPSLSVAFWPADHSATVGDFYGYDEDGPPDEMIISQADDMSDPLRFVPSAALRRAIERVMEES